MTSAYDHLSVEGETINRRTLAYYRQVQKIYGLLGGTGTIRLVQGSFSNGSLSGGTHRGGGAMDLMLSIETSSNYKKLEKASRMCMGAGFYRTPADGFDPHCHIIVLGDKTMSDAAAKQVIDYHKGLNALASHLREPSTKWRPHVLFNMSYPLGVVDYSVVRAQAMRKSGWTSYTSVKRIQHALNIKIGTTLVFDGIFGPATKAAYKRFEAGWNDYADGVPQPFGLWCLGAGRFNVKQ